jgi:diacylglycerol kinase family enzyme
MKMQAPSGGRPWGSAHGDAKSLDYLAIPRVGIISNFRSHRNSKEPRRPLDLSDAVVVRRVPETREALANAVLQFAREGVDLIVVDGGDGTVREVMSAAHRVYRGHLPRLAILRSGKTNALALDLGIPQDWTLEDAVAAHLANRVVERSPVHVHWTHANHPDRLGFIFGFGAYSRATLLAQKVHKQGWFNGFAVLMTLLWAVLQTFMGGSRGPWTRGDTIRISRDKIDISREKIYLVLGSTLRHMPLGLKPFGRPRDGLKFLAIKAPPRNILRLLLHILRGTTSPRQEEDGHIRQDVDRVFLSIRKSFVLDGERFPGGNLAVSRGTPIEFVVP